MSITRFPGVGYSDSRAQKMHTECAQTHWCIWATWLSVRDAIFEASGRFALCILNLTARQSSTPQPISPTSITVSSALRADPTRRDPTRRDHTGILAFSPEGVVTPLTQKKYIRHKERLCCCPKLRNISNSKSASTHSFTVSCVGENLHLRDIRFQIIQDYINAGIMCINIWVDFSSLRGYWYAERVAVGFCENTEKGCWSKFKTKSGREKFWISHEVRAITHQWFAVMLVSEFLWYHQVVRLSPSGGRGRFSGPSPLAAPPGWRGYAACGWRPWFCRRPRLGQIHSPAWASSPHLCLMASHGLATWTLRSSCIWRRDREVVSGNAAAKQKTKSFKM